MRKSQSKMNIDYRAIAGWLASGFFSEDEYFTLKHKKKTHTLNLPSLNWYYAPEKKSFENILYDFTNLFDSLIKTHTKGKKIILPLSGGLDSRTLAASLMGNENVIAYSYEFANGVKEIKYAKQIAEICGWEFHSFTIPKGYLWKKLDLISKVNDCKTEFTHPRQMAVLEEVSYFGELFLSGSMGDLLFDSHGPSNLKNKNPIELIKTHTLKPSGVEIASEFWNYWSLKDSFETYYYQKIERQVNKINIKNLSGLLRAFKSMYYVRNWTNVNMEFFTHFKTVYAPYHDNKMCDFVCKIPEEHLKNRKIQIEYIKSKAPELARIKWQKYDIDLYNFKKFNTTYIPKRVFNKSIRLIKEKVLMRGKEVERNWEIQFYGTRNDNKLKTYLFDNASLFNIVPKSIILEIYRKFKFDNPVKYSHSISMLLTLSIWSKKYFKND